MKASLSPQRSNRALYILLLAAAFWGFVPDDPALCGGVLMSAWARPGVKCVCVDASGGRSGDRLKVGAVYTVIEMMSYEDDFGQRGIRVVEATSDHYSGAYRLSRFRPLITQEDDVRLIKSLLISNPVDAGLVPAGVEFSE